MCVVAFAMVNMGLAVQTVLAVATLCVYRAGIGTLFGWPSLQVVPVILEPGDALIFHGELAHYTPPNITNQRFACSN